MKVSAQMTFFIFLLEQYAAYKNTTSDKVLRLWDNLGISDFIFNMYEMYHTEALTNAFEDIELIISNKVNS